MGLFDSLKSALRGSADPSGAGAFVAARVVGTEYYEFPRLKAGTSVVMLVREPGNPYDSNAIAVRVGNAKIGHLSRHLAEDFAPLMDRTGQGAIRVSATVQHDGEVDVHLPAPGHSLWGGVIPPPKQPKFIRPLASIVEPWGPLSTQIEVEEEYRHRAELGLVMARLGEPATRLGHEFRDVEALVVTPRPGEPTVVSVGICGLRVGRLSLEDELTYRPALASLANQSRTLKVTARIWAVDDGQIRGRVVLNMPAPDEVLPPPSLPPGPVVVLPPGAKVQVSGEEDHLQLLTSLLGHRQQVPIAASLHTFTKQTARSSRDVIEVRCAGQRVGELTPTMSQHFLPLAALCEERGTTLVCRAHLRGNALKADVVLDATKAGDLTQAWIDANLPGRTLR